MEKSGFRLLFALLFTCGLISAGGCLELETIPVEPGGEGDADRTTGAGDGPVDIDAGNDGSTAGAYTDPSDGDAELDDPADGDAELDDPPPDTDADFTDHDTELGPDGDIGEDDICEVREFDIPEDQLLKVTSPTHPVQGRMDCQSGCGIPNFNAHNPVFDLDFGDMASSVKAVSFTLTYYEAQLGVDQGVPDTIPEDDFAGDGTPKAYGGGGPTDGQIAYTDAGGNPQTRQVCQSSVCLDSNFDYPQTGSTNPFPGPAGTQFVFNFITDPQADHPTPQTNGIWTRIRYFVKDRFTGTLANGTYKFMYRVQWMTGEWSGFAGVYYIRVCE